MQAITGLNAQSLILIPIIDMDNTVVKFTASVSKQTYLDQNSPSG